jgi:hypothetical protein
MGAARPVRRRACRATPMPHARRQAPRHPQRWGRLLALGLALVLVAGLVPWARAGDGADSGVPDSSEPLGNGVFDADMLEAQTLPRALAPTTPEAPSGADGTRTDTVVSAQGGEVTDSEGPPPGGEEQPLTPAPLVVAGHDPAEPRQAGQPPGDQQRAAATGGSGDQGEQAAVRQGEPEQAGRDEEGDDDPTVCAGGCSTEPPAPGDTTVPAASGSLGGAGRALARWLRSLGETFGLKQPQATQEPAQQQPEEPPQATQPRQEPQLTIDDFWYDFATRHLSPSDIAREIYWVEEGLRQGQHRLRTQREIAEGEWRMYLLTHYIESLQREPSAAPAEQSGQLNELMTRAVEANRQLVIESRASQERTPLNLIAWGLENINNQLNTVLGLQGSPGNEDEVERLINDAHLTLYQALDRIRQLEAQGLQGTESEKLAELASRAEEMRRLIEGENPMTMVEAPRSLATPPADGRTPQVPGPTGFPSQQDKHEELVTGAVGFPVPTDKDKLITQTPGRNATSAEAVGGGRLTSVNTELAPMSYVGGGLAVLLAAMLAVGCKGAPCSTMLRPAFRGFQGVPGQVVPGHLQG